MKHKEAIERLKANLNYNEDYLNTHMATLPYPLIDDYKKRIFGLKYSISILENDK